MASKPHKSGEDRKHSMSELMASARVAAEATWDLLDAR